MNQPGLYANNNNFQQKDAMYVLKKYSALIRWKTNEEENVLDVGCGDGTVTANILYPFLPKNVRKLVAVDVLPEMIEFAKARHRKRNLVFEQLDISTKQLGVELKEKFDHIFSFSCLNWVQDQRQCALNLFSMLKPGGDIVLTFAAKAPIYQVYESLSKREIWAEYMKDVEQHVGPYHRSTNPANDFRNLLCQVGFHVNLCEVVDRSYTFKDIFSWKKWTMALNPFLGKVSDDLKEEHINDILSEMKKLNCTVLNDNEETVRMEYTLFAVYARKLV